MVIVFVNKLTPRISYIFKHVFVRILNIPVSFTTTIEEFVAHNGPKMSYTKVPLGGEFHVRCNDLLNEQGVNDIDITINKWDDVPCFFTTSAKSSIPFDIFAASFYLISRYEEYLPHVQDHFERYDAKESLAFKSGFLDKPVVDIWAYKFLENFREKFPNYDYSERSFEFISTFDIDNAYAYKHKGFVRNFGGFFRDILRFRFKNLFIRILVLLRLQRDPYDTYDFILRWTKRYNLKTIFFFLIGDYTTYDTNVSSSNSKYRSLIKSIADYVKVGLHPSFYTMHNTLKLKKEKQKMEQITNRPVIRTRQHFLRMKIPETYQNLIDLEVQEDYTMGYASHYGFRASTCTPFYFYDLDFEIQTPLKVFPFAVMDGTLNIYLNYVPAVSKSKIFKLINEVRAVNGTFILLFHNETVSELGNWKGWRKMYKEILEFVHD